MKPRGIEAIVIGVSAGAVDALARILPVLPGNYPLPVVIVVHLPPDTDSLIVDLFGKKCSIDVVEAEDKAPVLPGRAYFAPPNYHLQIENDFHFSLSNDVPVHFSRPAVDVLFQTAADAYEDRVMGVVLTGASCDGAAGLRSIVNAGGAALIQRPEDAFMSIMPEAAIQSCPEAKILSLEQIANCLLELGANR
jgi:two-component system chemotaxis response regulator CheB